MSGGRIAVNSTVLSAQLGYGEDVSGEFGLRIHRPTVTPEVWNSQANNSDGSQNPEGNGVLGMPHYVVRWSWELGESVNKVAQWTDAPNLRIAHVC